ncbi:small ribosomal subunit protein bS16m [Culicoides brevitarsis]|uniref:small ribosomal subunit protein bS16m n=1 Tax=Culicoides brevitarsis TaxID=469753 RepID=UPI00307CC61D
MSLTPASGTGVFYRKAAKIIRLHRKGCANRPFFHIVVTQRSRAQHEQVIEQLGTFDPLTNQYGERLIALNCERIRHWIGSGSHISDAASEVLGIAGLLPVHPRTMLQARRNRAIQAAAAIEAQMKEKEKVEQ